MSLYYISGGGFICKTTGHGQCIVLGTIAGCEDRAELDKMIAFAAVGSDFEADDDAIWVHWLKYHPTQRWQFDEQAKERGPEWEAKIIAEALK